MATAKKYSPEDALLKAARTGDSRAMELLFLALEQPLYAFSVKLTGDYDRAADLYQEAIYRGLRAFPEFRADEFHALRSWLFRIAHNIYRDSLRLFENKNQALEEIPPSALPTNGVPPISSLIRDEMLGALKDAELNLPEAEREVFVLRHYADLPFQEIAHRLDCPLNTVLTRMHRAIGRLKMALFVWKS